MKASLQKLSKSKIELKIEVPSEEFKNFYRKAVSILGDDLQVEGFRKGKAPSEVLEKTIGTKKILNKAAQLAVKKNYLQAVQEKGLEPIQKPEIKVLKLAPQDSFVFKAQTEVIPSIKLPSYKKIASKAELKEVSVSSKEVKNTLQQLRKSRAEFSKLDRKAKSGDFVEIKFSSPQFPSSKKTFEDKFILGQGHFIPGFEEKLIGMEAGDRKEFQLKIPEDYSHKQLAGKKAEFKVKMISVKEMKLPSLDDKFAQSLGKFETLEDLKQNVKQGLRQEKQNQQKQKFQDKVLQKIAQQIDWNLPSSLIGTERKRLMDNFKENISQRFKISLKDYLKRINKSEKEIKKHFTQLAQKRIKHSLILREIARKENIQASPQEVQKETQKILSKYPDPQKARKQFDPDQLKKYTKEVIINRKIFKLFEDLSQKNARSSNRS